MLQAIRLARQQCTNCRKNDIYIEVTTTQGVRTGAVQGQDKGHPYLEEFSISVKPLWERKWAKK